MLYLDTLVLKIHDNQASNLTGRQWPFMESKGSVMIHYYIYYMEEQHHHTQLSNSVWNNRFRKSHS